jgi:cytochrome c oxidase subunit 2
MFAVFDTFLPPQASEFAARYDKLFWYVTAVITVGGLLVYAGIVYFCFKYARRPGDRTPRILGNDKIEVIWTVVPALFFLSFFAWGTPLFMEVTRPPADATEIFVVGKQWMWKVQHPNGVREINEIHLPRGRPIKLTGTSEDVIHDIGIPAFRFKIDVVPGRYVQGWVTPTQTGTYHLFCDQYCGMGHSQMVGKVIVMEPEEYDAWLDGLKPTAAPGTAIDGSPAWEGRKLFLKLQCITCHYPAADPDEPGLAPRAPNLEGLFGSTVPLQGGRTVVADEAYIRESIRNPMAKIREGWRPIMPAYPRAQVSEEELINLVTYIKSLRPGDLPRRTDVFPAPVGAPTEETEAPGTTPTPAPAPKNENNQPEGGSQK